MKVGLRREDALSQPKWSVGANHIAAILLYIYTFEKITINIWRWLIENAIKTSINVNYL